MKTSNASRQVLPSFAELLDQLTITQIKSVLLPDQADNYVRLSRRLQHDLDLLLADRELSLDASLLRKIIQLAQINLHIWQQKDAMQQDCGANEEAYSTKLKLAHQLNGIRNQLKNNFNQIVDTDSAIGPHTNCETDELDISHRYLDD